DFSDSRKDAPRPIEFDVRGTARAIDLRRFPREAGVPRAATNVNAAYHVAGTVTTGEKPTADVSGDATFEPSTVAGARIAGGSKAGFRITGPSGRYDVAYNADATVADLDLQRVGSEFRIPALADDRYKSSINGHISANGSGTKPDEMDL